MQRMVNQASGKLRRAMAQGISKANKEAGENEDVKNALGWSEDGGEFQQLSIADKTKVLEQAKRMKHMADIVGKIKNITKRTQQTKIKSDQVEICGVSIGDNIVRVLPQELLYLSHPALKLDFYRRMSEKQLLQYELKQKEELGRGSIVVLLDDSGSMYGNDRRELARGACLGLLDIAKHDHRNFAVNIFAGNGAEWKREYPKGILTIQETLELMDASLGGGTYYDKPMKWALEKVQEDTFKDADIVLITDGDCDLSEKSIEEVIKLKKELNTKIHCISVDSVPSHLSRWCDTIWKNLNEDSLEEMIGGIV